MGNDSVSSSSVYLIYAVVYACGAAFLVPGLLGLRRFTRSWRQDPTAVRLYGLLALGASLRAAAFILVAVWMFALCQLQASGSLDRDASQVHLSYLRLMFLWQVLGATASLVLAGVFLLVLNTWASMVDKVQGKSSTHSSRKQCRATDALLQNLHTRGAPDVKERRDSGASAAPEPLLKPLPPPRLLFMRIMLAVYLLQIGTLLVARREPRNRTRRSLLATATVLLVCCWIACVILLPTYGEKMCVLLDKVAEDARHRKRNIRRIAFTAALFCLMQTVPLLLLAASQCTLPSDKSPKLNVAKTLHPDMDRHVTLDDVVQANPAFFFLLGPAAGRMTHVDYRVLRWIVETEVLKFPLEVVTLMALLCVLPSRPSSATSHGYQPISGKRKWQP
ncbi:unnamed protein product [Hyaloperonospora brassicae]|uniref:RxLR effector candidate protein n=1 Tax=Hyaloperonospora brassicae TaxID=162125 RepID=A0AAV0T779_HYABA|nr:unnamed protein product [Hyaloperonospora brassicae]